MIIGNTADPEDAKDDEENDFKEMPVAVVGDLEEYQFPCSEGVHGLSALVISRVR